MQSALAQVPRALSTASVQPLRRPVDPRATSSINPAWARLALGIQPKLSVSEPGDLLEREADAVADQVMRMVEPAAVGASPVAIQRKCAECEEERRRDEIRQERLALMPVKAADRRGAQGTEDRGGMTRHGKQAPVRRESRGDG